MSNEAPVQIKKPDSTMPAAKKWRDLGDRYREEKDFEKSLNAYRKAVEADNNDDYSHYWLGRLYYHNKMDDEAKKSFQNAIVANPKNADAYYRLGLIHYMENKFDSAIKYFTKAIEIQPEFPRAFYSRGLASIKINQQEGYRRPENAIRQDPKLDRAYFNLGDIYLKKLGGPQLFLERP